MLDPWDIDSHKLDLHPDRVSAWVNAKSSEEKLSIYPIYVEISPVGFCSHRCKFCSVDYIGYVNRKISTPILCSTLDSMASVGVKSVMMAGEGEPMLHPDIIQLTNHAALAGLDVAFTTNGTALTQKFIQKSLQNVKWIKVSMNGGEKTYATVHQTAERDYERVWANLQNAVEFRRREGLSCVLGLQCVVLDENLCDLEGLASRAKETGLDYLVCKPFSQGKHSINRQYEKIRYEKLLATLEGLERFSGSQFRVIVRKQAMEGWDDQDHKYTKCYATPSFWAYIMATGDVYTCSAYLLKDEFKMGNINDASFKDIWTSDKRRQHLINMETLDISQCRVNCRMNQANKYLDRVVNAGHRNFI